MKQRSLLLLLAISFAFNHVNAQFFYKMDDDFKFNGLPMRFSRNIEVGRTDRRYTEFEKMVAEWPKERLELEISESQCKSLGHALKRMGYKQAHGGLPIKAGQRKLARYWVIREVTNEWDYTEVQNHLKGWDKKHPAGAGCKF